MMTLTENMDMLIMRLQDNTDEELMFGKGMIDAYLAPENCAIYSRDILSGELLKNAVISVDADFEGLPQDEDG